MYDAPDGIDFIIAVAVERQLAEIRGKLGSAGLEEIAGDTSLEQAATQARSATRAAGASARQGARPPSATAAVAATVKKPYGFAPIPSRLRGKEPIWHDGSSSAGKLSGELRCELETLTPLLVGWERQPVSPEIQTGAPEQVPTQRVQGDREAPEVTLTLDDWGSIKTGPGKSLLCPLRAPWGERPVILPADSLKGLLRHELGALLGAPMERVDERSYSYRPNQAFPNKTQDLLLEPRLARVKTSATRELDGVTVQVPEKLEIFEMATRDKQTYYPNRDQWRSSEFPPEVEPYRGGMGGGKDFPRECLSPDAGTKTIHTHIDVKSLKLERTDVLVPAEVITQYLRTLRHLADGEHGHFSGRHPYIGKDADKRIRATSAIRDASQRVISRGDILWVEWDKEQQRLVSFGWHYYYRWAYQDTVCTRWAGEATGEVRRAELSPTAEETAPRDEVDSSPSALTVVRRLFGYTGDSAGSKGIGDDKLHEPGNHSQLMGRIAINAALEVVAEKEAPSERFLPPTFLKELGQPKPSAVEHYLRQPYGRGARPSDAAKLATYGDAGGYDRPGELAGRKLYLDRADGAKPASWEDPSDDNRRNERSTLAIEASKKGRRFRFTVRFRDLDEDELAAVMLALCPQQFAKMVGGEHSAGYCSKLGYARPLGWGSVQIRAAELYFLEIEEEAGREMPTLTRQDGERWFETHRAGLDRELLSTWLALHRRSHPDAADYPRDDKDGQIYTHHTKLRAEHSRQRRYRRQQT
jgi:CRISPR-associated protein (TIGR03986 family)